MIQRFAILTLIAICLLPRPSAAQLSLDADFDHGSLAGWSGDLSTINLSARDNYYGNNRWRWMYFRAMGVAGATPTFTIEQNFAGDSTPGPHELAEHEMVYSYDNENWHFFQNNQLIATGTDHFQFSNNSPFVQDEVSVAYAIPYSYGKSVSHTQAVLASPWGRRSLGSFVAGMRK